MIKRANFDDKSYQLLSSNLHQFIIKVRSIYYRTSLVSSAKQMESFVKDCQEVSQSLWVCLTSCWVLLDFMVSFAWLYGEFSCKTHHKSVQNPIPSHAKPYTRQCSSSRLFLSFKIRSTSRIYLSLNSYQKISNLNKWEKLSFPWSLQLFLPFSLPFQKKSLSL